MTALPAAGYFSDPARTNAEAKTAQDDMLAFVRQMLGGQASTELTIASGSAVPTRGMHTIDTEADAASDDLANLDTTNLPDGSWLLIGCANAARVVTVQHNAGGAGQIALADADDAVLDATSKYILLRRSGANWAEIGRFGFVLPIAQGGTGATDAAAARAALGIVEGGYPADGRLTLTTGVPVTTGDVTAAGTLYYTPYIGNRLALYSGSAWSIATFTERSLALSGLTSGLPYDVFVYDNAGTPTLELTAWTNGTTRATALTRQDGVLVKSGAATRRYLGTIYTTGTATTEDSAANRFVWNAYNRVERPQSVVDTTASWTYTSSTWRQANNSASNQYRFVTGLAEDAAEATAHAYTINTSSWSNSIGIGVNSITANAAQIRRGSANSSGGGTSTAFWRGVPAVGLTTVAWLESSSPNATTTWYGAALNSDNGQSGMVGRVRA